jgi:hypothetical protein
MTYANGDLTQYLFLQMGVVWVLGVSLLYGGAMVVGARAGGRAAAKYTKVLTGVFFVGIVAIAGHGYFSGELARFWALFGAMTLFELLLLGAGCVWLMWYMATSYANSRIAQDEKFGSKAAYLRAKAEAKLAQAQARRDALDAALDGDSGGNVGASPFSAENSPLDCFPGAPNPHPASPTTDDLSSLSHPERSAAESKDLSPTTTDTTADTDAAGDPHA